MLDTLDNCLIREIQLVSLFECDTVGLDVVYYYWSMKCVYSPSVSIPCVIAEVQAANPKHWSYFRPLYPPILSNYQPNRMFQIVQCQRYSVQQPVQHRNSKHLNLVPSLEIAKRPPENWEHRNPAKWCNGTEWPHATSTTQCRSDEMFAWKSLYNFHTSNIQRLDRHHSASSHARVQFDPANIDGIWFVASRSLYLALEWQHNCIPRP